MLGLWGKNIPFLISVIMCSMLVTVAEGAGNSNTPAAAQLPVVSENKRNIKQLEKMQKEMPLSQYPCGCTGANKNDRWYNHKNRQTESESNCLFSSCDHARVDKTGVRRRLFQKRAVKQD